MIKIEFVSGLQQQNRAYCFLMKSTVWLQGVLSIFHDFFYLTFLKQCRRGRDTTGVSDRVVNQLLTSLDGVDSPAEAGVWVIAASSRPDLIDRALLRPGRFDTMLHCNLPVQEERDEILKILSKNLQLSCEVDLNKLAQETEGFCGADIQVRKLSKC